VEYFTVTAAVDGVAYEGSVMGGTLKQDAKNGQLKKWAFAVCDNPLLI